MKKTILITGSTDGIGLETAKLLVSGSHRVLRHGRSEAKLEAAEKSLSATHGGSEIERYVADLSRMSNVDELARAVSGRHATLDVLINNAGVYNSLDAVTPDGLDVRFAVNTIAPYLLTRRLLPVMAPAGRVVNLSSAAQAPVDIAALEGKVRLSSGAAYAQSKLALTMWSRSLALELEGRGPAIIAVNPGSLLKTKMVIEAFGSSRAHASVGAKVLARAALDDEFAEASGRYFDNDVGRFASPHPDAMDPQPTGQVVQAIEGVLARLALVSRG